MCEDTEECGLNGDAQGLGSPSFIGKMKGAKRGGREEAWRPTMSSLWPKQQGTTHWEAGDRRDGASWFWRLKSSVQGQRALGKAPPHLQLPGAVGNPCTSWLLAASLQPPPVLPGREVPPCVCVSVARRSPP